MKSTCNCGTLTVFSTTCTRKWGFSSNSHDLHLWNLHDMHTQDIGHLVNELQLWIRNGRLNSQDHGDQPLRNDREDNDLVDELQLRNFHSFLRDDTTDTGIAAMFSISCNCGISTTSTTSF